MAQQEEYAQGAELWRGVCETYDAAQRSGAAASIDTQSEVLPDAGIEFVIRLATALRAKPKGDVQSGVPAAAAGASGGKAAAAGAASQPAPAPPPRNPFLPPDPALTVGHLSATHTLLLNKFNVVPHHLLVVTREFRSQQEPLAAADLAATLRVLRAMPRGGLAFYNCGEHSGRSQPHKHLQVVPLPFFEGQPERPPIQVAVDAACSGSADGGAGAGGRDGGSGAGVLALRQLPFRAYAVRFTDESLLAPDQLEAAARQLVAACQRGLGESPVSYNLVLTQQLMLAVPRRREMSGPCAVNSLGFAGTLLVRSEEEAAHVRAVGPLAVLAEVGCPW